MCESTERRFFNDEAYAKACLEIEKLRSENSQLKEQWLEFSDEMLSFTGLPGHLHRLDVKMKQLKSLLTGAADALENGPSETHLQLVQKLRKAAE